MTIQNAQRLLSSLSSRMLGNTRHPAAVAKKYLAALKAYGLIEDAPGSNGKQIKLSQRSIRILLDDQNSTERSEEIKKAALAPKWYEYCWRTWGRDLPPSMRSNLLIEHGFVDTTINGFLKDYRKTIAFAGLMNESIELEETPQDSIQFKVGDWVQWESNGVLCLPNPKRLSHFSPDQEFAFVEDSSTGIPVAELVKPDEIPILASTTNSKPSSPMPGSPSVTRRPFETTRLEVFSIGDGTSVEVRWPASFSKDSLEDFSDWLELLKKKIKRTITTDSAE